MTPGIFLALYLAGATLGFGIGVCVGLLLMAEHWA